jgi:hypothetical protein
MNSTVEMGSGAGESLERATSVWRARSRSVAALLAATAVLSCGTRAADAPAIPPEGLVGTEVPADPEPELSPVAAPEDLFAVARLNALPATVDTLMTWMGLPVDWREQLTNNAPGILEALNEAAAIEFAATLDPEALQSPRVFFAISLPLESREAGLELAQQRGWQVEHVGPGRDRVDAGQDCMIAASVGSAKARWVCANGRAALDALEPYLTRGLPNEPVSTHALFASVSIEPFRKRYADKTAVIRSIGIPFLLRELGLDNPTFDAALADAAHGLGDELVALVKSDLKSFSITGEMDAAAERLLLTAELELQAATSWTGRALQDAGRRKGSAPDLFWRIPPGLEASYSVKGNPGLTHGLSSTLSSLLEGWLVHAGASPEAARQLREKSLALNEISGPIVFASKAAETERSWAAQLGGQYWLMVLEGDEQDALGAWLERLAKVAGDEQLKKSLKGNELLPHGLPAISQQPVQVGPLKGKLTQLRFSSEQSAWLGKVLEADVQPEASLTLGVLLAREGSRSWFASGVEPNRLAAALLTLRDASASPVSGLDLLQRPANSGGFTRLRAFADKALSALRKEQGRNQHLSSQQVLASLPHKGETPIPFLAAADSHQPKGSLYIHLSKDTLRDFAAAVLAVSAAK